jgi:hypothetical protein
MHLLSLLVMISIRNLPCSMKRINDIAYKIVANRRKAELSGEKRNAEHNGDILGLYLTRQDLDGELSDKELRDIVLNIMLAGRDTTANVSHPSLFMRVSRERIMTLFMMILFLGFDVVCLSPLYSSSYPRGSSCRSGRLSAFSQVRYERTKSPRSTA